MWTSAVLIGDRDICIDNKSFAGIDRHYLEVTRVCAPYRDADIQKWMTLQPIIQDSHLLNSKKWADPIMRDISIPYNGRLPNYYPHHAMRNYCQAQLLVEPSNMQVHAQVKQVKVGIKNQCCWTDPYQAMSIYSTITGTQIPPGFSCRARTLAPSTMYQHSPNLYSSFLSYTSVASQSTDDPQQPNFFHSKESTAVIHHLQPPSIMFQFDPAVTALFKREFSLANLISLTTSAQWRMAESWDTLQHEAAKYCTLSTWELHVSVATHFSHTTTE